MDFSLIYRLAELPTDKKSKLTKYKSKANDRRHLSNVRVVQRNLVYVVGLPLIMADEEVLVEVFKWQWLQT